MYNFIMPLDTYEIRKCRSCGLRYPWTNGNAFGERCPVCLGETELTLSVRHKPDLDVAHEHALEGRGEFAVLLDNIRSAWNVGSIFRSADGFGFTHAYICGITPTPESEAVMKTSLGAEDTVTWSYHKDAVQLAQGLKKEGWQIWALEEHERSVPLAASAQFNLPRPVILILGSEVTGVDPGLVDLADEIFYIPMYGEKTSFNVATAFGIAAYQFTGLSA